MRLFNIGFVRGHHYIRKLLDTNSIIVDLGGHKGEFSSKISEEHNCMCHTVEAHPYHFRRIKESDKVKKHNHAVVGNEGETFLYLSHNPESHTVIKPKEGTHRKIKVNSTTLKSFIHRVKLKKVDLLKVDIEGSEIELFDSTPAPIIKSIKQITIEFHDFIDSELKPDVKRIIKYLKNLGFFYINFSPMKYHDVLFINRDHYSKLDYFFLKYFSKNIDVIYRKYIKFRSSKQMSFVFNLVNMFC